MEIFGDIRDMLNEMKSCKFISSGIVFLTDQIRFCCEPETYSPICAFDSPEMDIDFFLDFRERVHREPLESCRNCAHLQPIDPAEFDRNRKLTYINLAHGDTCNFKCEYCFTVHLQLSASPPKYKLLPILNKLHECGLIDENCVFCLSSGEPTLNQEFSDLLDFAVRFNGYNMILSNCSVYSAAVYNLLREKRGYLLCSVDAGTQETFKDIKSVDLFDVVISNLSKYSKSGGEVIVKYIIYDRNCGFEEMISFIRLMYENGLNRVFLTMRSHMVVSHEHLSCAAIGMFLANAMGMNVFFPDRLEGSRLINLKESAEAIIADKASEFTEILQKEFQNETAPFLSQTLDRILPCSVTKGYIDHPVPADEISAFSVNHGMILNIAGWIINEESKSCFSSVYIKIGSGYYKATPCQRPDVAEAFGQPNYSMSGFSASIISTLLPAGKHKVEIAGITEDGRQYIANHTIDVEVTS